MPNPKRSTQLKKLSGTYRPDRERPKGAGDRLTETPEPPDSLSYGARKEWEALAPVLVEMGTVCRADLRAFEQLTETLATQVALQAIISSEGVLIKTGTGSHKTNPAMRSLETARNQAARMYEQFGITPKSRSYVTPAPGPSGYDPFDHLDDDAFE